MLTDDKQFYNYFRLYIKESFLKFSFFSNNFSILLGLNFLLVWNFHWKIVKICRSSHENEQKQISI